MNIVILSDRYHPTPVSGAVLIYDLALELVEQKHTVYIMTADSSLKNEYEITKESGINILRIRAKNQKELSKPQRLLFELFLQRKIWKMANKHIKDVDFDLLVAHSPTIFWSFILKKLKNKHKNLKIYLILRDIFPKWAVDTKIITKFNPIYWFLRWHEKELYREADKIGVQSHSNLDYFKAESKELFKKVEVLYNWKRIGYKASLTSEIRHELGIEDKTIFIFGGNLGFAQDIENLLSLVNAFRDDTKIHFIFIGEGTEFNNIAEWIRDRNSNNLSLLPAVSDEVYQSILKECDVGIISLRSSFKTDNFPNKILNYMEYDLPILASINLENELTLLINNYKNGLVSNSGDIETLINNTRILLNDDLGRQKMGKRGKALLLNKFDSKTAIEKIIQLVNN